MVLIVLAAAAAAAPALAVPVTAREVDLNELSARDVADLVVRQNGEADGLPEAGQEDLNRLFGRELNKLLARHHDGKAHDQSHRHDGQAADKPHSTGHVNRREDIELSDLYVREPQTGDYNGQPHETDGQGRRGGPGHHHRQHGFQGRLQGANHHRHHQHGFQGRLQGAGHHGHHGQGHHGHGFHGQPALRNGQHGKHGHHGHHGKHFRHGGQDGGGREGEHFGYGGGRAKRDNLNARGPRGGHHRGKHQNHRHHRRPAARELDESLLNLYVRSLLDALD
ncbi:hypothetical protein BC835DRAFT_1416990 [Cytidiella melzeri]|nr:hypothetical protein BC835DRAFT_1416990 [Cytidiella melzeri]